MKRTRYSHRDKTHTELVKAMKSRMGGYWRDENGAHHAHLMGLPVDAYDMYKAGSGFPDWLVYVSWLAVVIEIKNLDGKPHGLPERTKKGALRKGFYTPDEILFTQQFHGIRRTFTEQNEIYDFLCQVAQFVLDTESEISKSWLKSYRELFFPKVDFIGQVTTGDDDSVRERAEGYARSLVK